MIESICQWVIMTVSTLSVAAAQSRKYQKWGCIFGLMAQPAWYYSTITHHQWGMIFLSVLITKIYLVGVWNFWLKEKSKGISAKMFNLVKKEENAV